MGRLEIEIERNDQSLRDTAAGWAFLHDLFRVPSAEQWQWLNEAWVRRVWARLDELTGGGHPRVLPLPEDYATYEQEYLGSFEVGLPAPPCPLIETYWNKRAPVTQIMHEHIMFYKAFGVELRLAAKERPDHLRPQLEFLSYLCRIENQAQSNPSRPGMAEEIARGRREFLMRHPGAWIPLAAAELNRNRPDHWPASWLRLLAAWCALQQDKDRPWPSRGGPRQHLV